MSNQQCGVCGHTEKYMINTLKLCDRCSDEALEGIFDARSEINDLKQTIEGLLTYEILHKYWCKSTHDTGLNCDCGLKKLLLKWEK